MKTNSLPIVILTAFLLIVSISACTSTKNIKAASVPPNTVIMADTKFTPNVITVPRGTTVVWQNAEDRVHTATANDKSWNTGDMKIGERKGITFDKPGTYPYHCTHHTMLGVGMTGTVIVQ
ncbi:MAG: cupredoxin domain-containing protein [Bacteroidota bacterium]|nr:cupredoxin domain-containing protein [Bacteroidota bacterium]MDP4231261.1 cupredoxin domain-containing protein [Bacteroidota bacterium]MDP4237181.1 cupredoxin domain-containing protein [Bacteroidota bacterium]